MIQVEIEFARELEEQQKMMIDPETYIKKLAAAGDVQKLNQLLSQIYFYQFANLNYGGMQLQQPGGNTQQTNFMPFGPQGIGIPPQMMSMNNFQLPFAFPTGEKK